MFVYLKRNRFDNHDYGGVMIKRISVFALSLLLLFSFVSCEGDTLKSIGKFMNGMGNSVVRPDTSSVNNVSQSAESAEKTEVEDEKSTVSVIASINGIDADSLTKIGDTDKTVSVVLKSLDEESKNELIVNINASISNSAGKDKLVSDMSAPVEGDAKTAAQGTATVMNNALSAIQNLMPDNNAIKTVADSLSTALSNIASAEEVSKADVVTLQLIDSFVNTVAGSLDTTGGSVAINDENKIISEANTMVTVASALSPASKFDVLSFSDLIPSLIGSRELSDGDLVIDGIKSKYIEIGLRVYDEINAIISKDSYKQAISALRLHKAAYETMVATTDLLKDTAELNNQIGNNLNAFIQYIVASAIVEADNLYGAVYNAVGKPEGIPNTVIGVLANIYSYNKDNNGFSENIIIPEMYIKLKESITNDDMLSKIKTEAYKALNIIGVNSNMTIVTINKVLKSGLKLDSILSGVDLESIFSDEKLEELI
ncbi:MAG: hypothetical protein SPJ34_09705, partial [Candidatus Ornithospirochaeta sp.]|nr:hypothetical protein [Candidatus Ornithospirochaeta sp.]